MYSVREAVEAFVLRLQSGVTPNVVLIGKNDLHETQNIPGIILQGPSVMENKSRHTPPGATKQYITNEPALTHEERDYPHFFNFDFNLMITCNTHAELVDLQEKVLQFFLYNATLDVTVDDKIHLHEITPVGGLEMPNLSNLRQAVGQYRMEDVVIYNSDTPVSGKLIEDRIFEYRDYDSEEIVETRTHS